MTLLSKQLDGETPRGGVLIQGKDTNGKAQDITVGTDGTLQVSVTGAGSGGTSSTDEATYTPTVSSGTSVMGARDDTGTDTLAEDKLGIIRATEYRALHVNLRDASGNELSTGGGTQYTEDVASAADPVGNMGMARRRDTLVTNEVSADGDNIALNATNKGQLHVKLADTVTVDGSGVTQPVSAASLPLPSGAATSAKQDTGNTSLASIDGKITAVNTGAVVVSSSALPTGAATAAKQPALGTAGTASSDVITVQGKAGMTAVVVDGSAVTQPVSIASVPSHAVTNAGTFVVQENGAALTSLQLIDDVVYTDDTSTHATGTSKGVGIMATATPTDTSVNANDIGMVAMTTDRRLLVDASGVAVPVTDNSGSLTVDNGGTFAVQAAQSGTWTVQPGNTANTTAWKVDGSAVTQPVSGTVTATIAAGATTIAKAEDVASADADVGVPSMAIQKSTPADTAGTDGDYAMLQMSGGRLWVDASGKTLTVASHAVTNAGTFATQAAITAASGSIASGAIASGAIASGAVASGAVASGAFASGALASGSIAVGAIATGATSIAANEDDASANLDTGVKILAVQKATPADTAGTDGDYMMPQMSAGRIWTSANIDKINGVTPLMGTGVMGTGSPRVTIASDNDALTVKQATGTNLHVVADSGSTTAVTGNVAVTVAAGAVAAGATSFVKLEDVASADADAGVPFLAVRKATPANTSGTDGDYEFAQISAGRLWASATIDAALPTGSNTIGALTANQSVNVAQFGGTTVVNGGTAGIQSIGGSTATNVALTENPLNLGAQAVSSENAAVTTGRKVQLVADLNGKLIVLPYANSENFVSGAITTAMTGTTTTSLLAAPAAGLRNYITQITVSNSHATVGTDLIIQDGSGGTTLYTLPAAPAYGGSSITFNVPLRQPTTATAIFCANVTTGANTKVSASGYVGK